LHTSGGPLAELVVVAILFQDVKSQVTSSLQPVVVVRYFEDERGDEHVLCYQKVKVSNLLSMRNLVVSRLGGQARPD
jgi:hypothetical protein